jgi:RHS repeat-associated protein
VVVTPVAPSVGNYDDYIAMRAGAAPGSNVACLLPVPALGQPISCSADQPPLAVSLADEIQCWVTPACQTNPLSVGLDSGCGCGGTCGGCGCGASKSQARSGSSSLDQMNAVMSHWQTGLQMPLTSALHGPAQVNVSNGNVLLTVYLPNTGPFDPLPFLVYNSHLAGTASEFGNGWGNQWKQSLANPHGRDPQVTKGSGYYGRYAGPLHGTAGTTLVPQGGLVNSLLQSSDGTYTETQPDGLKLKYNSSGTLSRLTSPAGDIWTMSYDSGGRLTNIADPFNRNTVLAYTSGGNIRRITDAAGRITTLTIPGADLTQIQTPDLATTKLVYNASHQLTRYSDALGNLTSYSYDPTTGWVTRIIGPNGGRTTLAYPSWTSSRITDPAGNITTLSHSPMRNVQSLVDPLGNQTNYQWQIHRLGSSTDARSNVTSYGYTMTADKVQRLQMVQSPGQGRFTFAYDSNSRVKFWVDPNGNRTTLVWDATALNNRKAVIDALGNRTSFSFNSHGQVTAITNPLNFRWTAIFDSTGNRVAQVDPLGRRTSYAYNAYRQLQRVQSPLGQLTTYIRDVMNRVVTQYDPLGRRSTNSYDAMGRLTGQTNPLNQTNSQRYTNQGLLLVTIDALGNRTSLAYDLKNNPIRTVNPLGRITTSVFDKSNRLIASVDPLGNRTSFGYDPAGNQTSVTNPLSERTTTVFDVSNRPIATIDALGNRTTTAYDLLNRPYRVQNPIGKYTTTIFDALSRVKATVDPLGNRTSFLYDADSRQIAVEDPLGNRTTTVYDQADEAIATIDPLGNRTTTAYDPAGRPIRVQNPLGNITTSIYDLANELVATMDPFGNRTSLSYNLAGFNVGKIDALNRRSTTVFDVAGRRISTIDPLLNRKTFVYDAASNQLAVIKPLLFRSTTLYDLDNRPIASIDPLSNRRTTVFDQAGQIVATLNALANRTTSIFDSAGRSMATIDPLLNRTTIGYDAAGRRRRVTNALGFITTTLYDDDNRITATIDGLGNRSSSSYDSASRLIRTTNPLGKTSTIIYDKAGRSIATINPLGNRQSTSYDAAGHPIRTTDANGNITTTVFDKIGRIIAGQNALTKRTSHIFDAAGQRVAIVDANGHRYTLSYDLAGRMTRLTDPLNRLSTSGYDAPGRRVLQIDARGNRTTLVYDATSRLTSKKYQGGILVVTNVFDGTGQRTVLSDWQGRATFTFDSVGRMKRVANHFGIMTYVYDNIGQRVQLIPSGGRFTYLYDGAGRIVRLTNPQTLISTWAYDSGSRVTSFRQGNGTRTSYIYDDANHIQRVANLNPSGTTISSYSYKYDVAGNRLRVIEANGDTVTWTYDPTYQLTRELRSGANAYANTFVWDSVGNRLRQQSSGSLTTYLYDSADQLSYQQDNTGRTTFVFDQNGNQLLQVNPAGGRTTYGWDVANNFHRILLPSGIRNTFSFDGDGHRVQKVDSSGTTNFQWDLENVLVEANASFTTTAVYTLAPGTYGPIISENRSAVVRFYHFDAVGSCNSLSNSTGGVTDTYINTGFGVPVSASGISVNPYRFVGSVGCYLDNDTGLNYVRARTYISSLGRWLSPDPLGVNLKDLSLYCFASNRPTVRIDASGLQTITLTPIPQTRQNRLTWDPPSAGYAHFGITWGITFPATEGGPNDGWIVQRIVASRSVWDKNLRKIPYFEVLIEYWEAWPVVNGTIYRRYPGRGGYSGAPDPAGGGANDIFHWPPVEVANEVPWAYVCGDETEGSESSTGWIKFWKVNELDIIKDKWAYDSVPEALQLIATRTEPSNWDWTGTGNDEYHLLVARWDHVHRPRVYTKAHTQPALAGIPAAPPLPAIPGSVPWNEF